MMGTNGSSYEPGIGASRMRSAASRKCGARVWSASSRCSIQVRRSNPFLSIGSKIPPAKIIRHDENDVGLSVTPFALTLEGRFAEAYEKDGCHHRRCGQGEAMGDFEEHRGTIREVLLHGNLCHLF